MCTPEAMAMGAATAEELVAERAEHIAHGEAHGAQVHAYVTHTKRARVRRA